MKTAAIPTRAFAEAMSAEAGAPPRVGPADVFNRAREIVNSGRRLDMVALGTELGISRATLYRWTGDRERLLSDILWTNVQALLEYIDATTTERGVARIEQFTARFLEALTTGGRLEAILRTEGDAGFRVITHPRGGVRPRLVAALTDRIQREVDDGFYHPTTEVGILTEGIVALGERFLYHGGDPDANPDPATARQIIALLVRGSTA
jgi:AcrR family transcriptional regulator